ncbi:MAG TPA: archaeosine biosynthesis radical SAM protein RaSEA [Euryarchaeota archaeon]|nr:archaeosine biosynthesis radical SAM protein RaSEA [Euryarchaeota archaeon]
MPRVIDLRRPASVWKEQDVIDGRRVDTMVTILRTTGCWWSARKGCLMCGYNIDSTPKVTEEHLRAQLANALERYDGEPMVKIYTSGSFLDEKEIPLTFREDVFKAFGDAERILFESRAEFITPDALDGLDPRSQVAIGLESANEEVLRKCVRKGFTVEDYRRAAEALDDANIPLRTYLLLKPPFLTERAAVEDAVASIAYASKYSESVSINPVNVQKGTVVESLFRRGDYRPPWLWSLIEVLRRGSELSECRIMSSPSGGGTVRGVHNCDACDRKILEAVQRFSFEQDIGELDGLECGCREEWAALMDVQGVMGTTVDVARHLSNELEFN